MQNKELHRKIMSELYRGEYDLDNLKHRLMNTEMAIARTEASLADLPDQARWVKDHDREKEIFYKEYEWYYPALLIELDSIKFELFTIKSVKVPLILGDDNYLRYSYLTKRKSTILDDINFYEERKRYIDGMSCGIRNPGSLKRLHADDIAVRRSYLLQKLMLERSLLNRINNKIKLFTSDNEELRRVINENL